MPEIFDTPLVSFTILLALILTIPPIFERLRLPGLVGLLIAGVLFGPNGLQLLDAKNDAIILLSDVGKIYLMFVAGLEIDLNEFRKTKNRSLGFGIATFILPLMAGTLVGFLFGFGANASILIGSLFASHTLLGYPIINRLGIVGNEAVTVTIGATILTDIASLLVLAICVSIHQGEFSTVTLILQLGILAIYSFTVLFGLDLAGKEYFRRTGEEQSNQFLFVLLAVFLASVGAQIINVDKIVGAFLAGLAVNDAVGRSPVKEKVEFVGSTLFIPIFFVYIGLLLDIPTFLETFTSAFLLTIAVLVGLIGSKFLAALTAKYLYGYTWNEILTMWSLSIPQVAATLAAALAALQVGLIPDSVFNTVIVLMLVTSILGPLLTARFANRLPIPKVATEPNLERDFRGWETTEELGETVQEDIENESVPFTVVVPIYNPLTQHYLIEMAALLANSESGIVVPLSITKAHVHMDDPELLIRLRQNQRLLRRAFATCQKFNVEVRPESRIDDDIAHGISRTAREQDASLIVMGWSEESIKLRSRLFGNVIDSVFWSAHCPIAVTRLLDSPSHFKQILVPVKNLMPQAIRVITFSHLLANANSAQVTFLHVFDPRTPSEQIEGFKSDLGKFLKQLSPSIQSEIRTVASDDVADVIIQSSNAFDLVILRSLRRRTAGGLAVSDVTMEVVKELTGSMMLFGEPHS